MYTTKTCKYCHLAEDLFNEHGVKYEKIDVGVDLAKRKEMVEKSGQMGVPVFDIGGKVMVGYDEDTLKQLLALN
jgi:glutaredoxin 3